MPVALALDQLSKLVVVDVKLTRGTDDPQLVFESMNSTGKKLSQADLIRNFVLMDLAPAHQDPLAARRAVGYLPESPPLYPEMTVTGFLGYVAKIKDVQRSKRRDAVERSIEACGLTGVRGQVIGTLSKGYRQRVGLAQAIVHDPPVLILDEPTVGLDPLQIQEIRQLISELAAPAMGEARHTVVLSTHILTEVEAICRRVMRSTAGS